MAKINLGILDGFIGKVGTVVGFFWKGKPVMRGYKRSMRDPRTDAQLAMRKRFSVISELAASLRGALILGLGRYSQGRKVTECNSFVKLNLSAVTVDGGGAVNIAYSNLRVAEGPLPEVTFGQANFNTAQTVKVPFAGNTSQVGSNSNDNVYLVVYCPDLGDTMVSTPVHRSAQQATCEVPADWNGLQVHVWGFATGAASSESYLEASDSAYIGTGEIC